MQVEYIKEWMDTYLWILPDKDSPESYEEKMIRCNPERGWLAFSRQSKNGEDYLQGICTSPHTGSQVSPR